MCFVQPLNLFPRFQTHNSPTHLFCPGCSLKTAQHWGCRPRTFNALIRQLCRVIPERTFTWGTKENEYQCSISSVLLDCLEIFMPSFTCRKKKTSTHHSALLVWEVDTDCAASLGVGHLAIIWGATLAGKALDHGWGKARALKRGVLHSEAIAQGLPCSLEVLH